MDALPIVQTPPGHRFVSILLRHYDRYLIGTTDPDDRFCDFQNHVIHMDQGEWGGAPHMARRWYDEILRNLKTENYGDAAHAAGVLSHYFVDPLQPLHTRQSPRSRIIHRPLEWSVNQEYDDILRRWIENDLRIVFQLSRGPNWLGDAIIHCARHSSAQFESVVHEYDMTAAADRIADGLNDRLRMTLAGLFGLSITGWARVLERAAAEAESLRRNPLSQTSIAPSYLTATLRIPLQKWLTHLEYRLQLRDMEDLFREYRRRGKLSRHLPNEVDIIQRVAEVYADEQRYAQQRTSIRKSASVAANHPTIVPFAPSDVRTANPDGHRSDPRAA